MRDTIGGILVLAFFGGWIIWWIRARMRLFGEVGRELDRVIYRGTSAIRGIKNGRVVRASYHEKRSTYEDNTYETRVECDLPAIPFTLELRPQTMKEQERIAEGTAVDVQVGDPRFDERWVIEGAPADVVQRILDADTRQRFTRLLPEDLRQPHRNTLRLRGFGQRSPEWMIEGILLLVQMANAIEHAYEASDREAFLRAQAGGAPYRGEVRATNVEALRAREFEALRKIRRYRFWTGRFGMTMSVILAIAGLALLLHRC